MCSLRRSAPRNHGNSREIEGLKEDFPVSLWSATQHVVPIEIVFYSLERCGRGATLLRHNGVLAVQYDHA